MYRTNNYKELLVWKKAVDFTIELYEITRSFPAEERFGLVSQIRRAGVSIASNIAEGAGRRSEKDFSRFLDFAIGSCFEVQTQLTISMRLNLITKGQHESSNERIAEIEKMCVGLKRNLLR